ncbi:MAG: 3-oxoacyl-[acyl-carrier-protein] synthase III C-terminal domain-containing protein [Planctomycetota bacterium]
MTRPVYITAAGAFLPGEPVDNEAIEDVLGRVHGKASRARRRILQSNQILQRHYAIGADGQPTHRNCELAARAIEAASASAGLALAELELLSVATTMGDVLVPGFGSLVHQELACPMTEVSTSSGVCAASMMALKTAWLQVASGEKRNAVACGSELPSRVFRAGRFEVQDEVAARGVRFDVEFLRWMLSDGAGAVVLEDRPAHGRPSLRLECVELRSHADSYGSSMFGGGLRDPETRELQRGWLELGDEVAAARAGAFNLQQDIRMLDDLVKVGVDHFFDLLERRGLAPADLDWVLCHYSSHIFRGKIHDFLARAGVRIPEERWFTNLYTRGNTGAASIYIMLEEFLRTQPLEPGLRVLCMVPESGGFISSYALLTVVGPEEGAAPAEPAAEAEATAPETGAPRFLDQPRTPEQERLVRELGRVWLEFERRLERVPLIDRLKRGRLTLPEYRALLRDLRQQVIQGHAWMARMISSFSPDLIEVRAWALEHAVYGHADYRLLDHDFVACGGRLEEIQQAEPNVGTEALSAWMFHRAGLPDPLDLIGALYVVEGLSVRLCARWREQLQRQLGLSDDQLSFLVHHARHRDEHVTGPIEELLGPERLTPALVDRIVKTARVTARLYLLQLEEVAAPPA